MQRARGIEVKVIQLVWLLLVLPWLAVNRDFLCLAAEHSIAASAHPFRNVASWLHTLSLNYNDNQGLAEADVRWVITKE